MKKFSVEEIVNFLDDAMIFRNGRWWKCFRAVHIWYALENWLTLNEAFYVIWEEDSIKEWLLYWFYKIEDAYNQFQELEKFIKSKRLVRSDLMSFKTFQDLIRNVDFEKSQQIQEEPQKNKNGYIYLIESNWLYKIGKTKNVSSRIKKYITENPNEIILIHSYHAENYTDEEARLHEKFQSKRIRWEWFQLSEIDINYIKSL